MRGWLLCSRTLRDNEDGMSNEAEQALQEMEAAEDEERELEEVSAAVPHIELLQQRTWGLGPGRAAACAACQLSSCACNRRETCPVRPLCGAGWTDREPLAGPADPAPIAGGPPAARHHLRVSSTC